MASRNMTSREKTILIATAAVAIGALLYNFFLVGFLDRLDAVNSNLKVAEDEFALMRNELQAGKRVDEQYAKLAAALPKREPGRRPEMVFTEEIAKLCSELNISPAPTIKPHKIAEIPDVPGFSYLILPIEGIQGDVKTITDVLAGFYQRSFIILEMHIASLSSESSNTGQLTMSMQVAQIVRTEEVQVKSEKEAEKSEQK
jgi:hypothetical protein